MKIAEVRELSAEDLEIQIQTTNKALFEARFKHAMHQLGDTAELGRLKHLLSQLKFVLSQKNIPAQAKG